MSHRSLEEFATHKLRSLERRKLKRQLTASDRFSATELVRDGETLISFACNDYLGLSHEPSVIEASVEATRRYGVGAGASRLISGNHPLYRRLEDQLATIKASEDAIVFGSGYLTNIGVIPVLVGAPDLILIDEHCHSCLLAGARLSGSRVLPFAHNDLTAVRALLTEHRGRHRHCLVLTDGVFSMEGDLAPLGALVGLCEAHEAWLMSDDAHGLGVVGGGRGSSFAGDGPLAIPLQMGTLSKAVGAYGGYLCASVAVVELMRNRARSFVFSTGLPPGTVAAASRALEIIASDAELVARPLERARLFTRSLGLPEAESPIVPLILESAERALAASESLRAAGFFVPAIRPPTVPPGTSRLRFAFSALHSDDEVLRLSGAVAELCASR